MAVVIQSFDGGTEGAALTTVTTATNGDTACGTVNYPGSLIYASAAAAHGAFGARVVPSSGAIREYQWNITAAGIGHFVGYFTRRAAWTANHNIFQLRSASGLMCSVGAFSSTQRINLTDRLGNLLFSSVDTATTVDQLYRIEVKVGKGTGAGPASTDGDIEFRLYLAEATTPVATYTTAASDTGVADLTNMRLGRPSGTTTDVITEDWDSFRLVTAADLFGTMSNPWPAAPPSKINFTAIKSDVDETTITWTDPTDAPSGVAILRAPSVETGNDGNGLPPSNFNYDPSTISGVSTIASAQFSASDSPYIDPSLSPISYSYWLVRET